MRGRRGQGFLPSSTGEWVIVLLLLAVIVVAVIVTQGKLKNVATQLPSDTTAAIAACKVGATEFTRQAYCDQLRTVTIGGVSQLATCPYIAKEYSDAQPTVAVDCSSYGVQNGDVRKQSEKKCAELFKQGNVDSDTTANGLVCSSLTCTALSGTVQSSADACVAPRKIISKGFAPDSASPAGSVCCVG
jgi:hypothetical protein